MKKTVLCVSSHPDDLEVGASGTLMKHLAGGDAVKVIIVTRGGYDKRTWRIAEQEIAASEEILGIKYQVLNHRMGYYHMNRETVKEMTDLVTRYEADVVFTHWYGDSHQDHRAVLGNVLAACRVNRVKALYMYELMGYGRSETCFKPNLFVDITPYMDKKLKAIQSYKSEADFTPQFIDSVRALASFRGSVCHTKYAEAFEVVFQCVT